MKITLQALSMLACAVLLGACASSGDLAIADVSAVQAQQLLRIGATSKADVRRLWGDAKVNQFASGYEVWSYHYVRHTPKAASLVPVVGMLVKGARHDTRELAVLFDQQGMVRKFQMRAMSDTD